MELPSTFFELRVVRVVVESHQKPLRLPDCDVMSAFDMAERESVQLRPLPDLLSLVTVWLPKCALGTGSAKGALSSLILPRGQWEIIASQRCVRTT